jgi:hypothetical protein
LKLLNTVGHTNRNGEERQEERREVREGTLDEGNLATLGQIHHFSIGQTTLYLKHDTR